MFKLRRTGRLSQLAPTQVCSTPSYPPRFAPLLAISLPLVFKPQKQAFDKSRGQSEETAEPFKRCFHLVGHRCVIRAEIRFSSLSRLPPEWDQPSPATAREGCIPISCCELEAAEAVCLVYPRCVHSVATVTCGRSRSENSNWEPQVPWPGNKLPAACPLFRRALTALAEGEGLIKA